ncbi:GspE/PulE family protein [Desulfonatronum thioautotrophicum]|uniref:GspE/PulE family protein n=1 Tax=Desulfonatronum thioautotrophicum TaxID=617001 RepID=UPI0005EB7CFF|nr:GspE/PulE family protein [Desulfonatronum thioautotrophicum]
MLATDHCAFHPHVRLEYSLAGLLPILEQAGELDSPRKQVVLDQARQREIALDAPMAGLALLLGLKLTRANAPRERLTEESVLRAVAARFGLEFKRLDVLELDLEVSTRTISEGFARTNLLVPLRIVDGHLEILAHNPFRPELWEDMCRVTTLPLRLFLGTRAEITRLIDDFYQFRQAVKAAEMEFLSASDSLANQEQRVQVGERRDAGSQKHVSKAVDYLLHTALRERASDIHLEPKRDVSLVRFRIDGVLHPLYRLPMTVHQAMISRLKGLSRLDISEKRRPQDGRVQLVLEETRTDVRVSTIPVAFGEKMVLRLLSSDTTLKKLNELGMEPDQLALFRSFLARSNSLVLVTGPTGSGKSTTLYSAMKNLAHSGVNVLTLEDPIEMVVDEFNQIGVQPKIGVDFGQVLRHILRQDPDIVMIGEMRDLNTAQEAVQAALTGHLVLSTLHTNDAASSITRLLDLGLDTFLINAALAGIVAQRLVRTLCLHCKVRVRTPKEQAALWRGSGLDAPETVWSGPGCEFCRNTGYLGRTGIHEILPFDEEIQDAIRRDTNLTALRRLVRAKGVADLFQSGMTKVRSGLTTMDEVIRVTGGTMQ